MKKTAKSKIHIEDDFDAETDFVTPDEGAAPPAPALPEAAEELLAGRPFLRAGRGTFRFAIRRHSQSRARRHRFGGRRAGGAGRGTFRRASGGFREETPAAGSEAPVDPFATLRALRAQDPADPFAVLAASRSKGPADPFAKPTDSHADDAADFLAGQTATTSEAPADHFADPAAPHADEPADPFDGLPVSHTDKSADPFAGLAEPHSDGPADPFAGLSFRPSETPDIDHDHDVASAAGNPIAEMLASAEAALGEHTVPRITIHAFCARPEMGELVQKASADRRMERAKTVVHDGGLSAAVEPLSEPTHALADHRREAGSGAGAARAARASWPKSAIRAPR